MEKIHKIGNDIIKKKLDIIKSAKIKDQDNFGTCFAYAGARNFVRTLQILSVIEADFVEQFFAVFYAILTSNKDCNKGGTYYDLIYLYNYLQNNYSSGLFDITWANIRCVGEICLISQTDKTKPILGLLPEEKKTNL